MQLQRVWRKTGDSDVLFSVQEGFDIKKITALKKTQCLFDEQCVQRISPLRDSETKEKGYNLKRNLHGCLEAARKNQANQKHSENGFYFHEGKALKFY